MKTTAYCILAMTFVAGFGLDGAWAAAPSPSTSPKGRVVLKTIPFNEDMHLATATYTPSGKVLVVYNPKENGDPRDVTLATMNDDGTGLRPFFAQRIPERKKDNGIRYMVFPDNRRIFLGDFVVECSAVLEKCRNPSLVPVVYPKQIADGNHIQFRWSEMVVAPDGRHIAWTTLFSNFAAAAFTGELQRDGDVYRIVKPHIISTVEPFRQDPRHSDGVIPQPVRGGEVKQFVRGGGALSLVGAITRDLPDSVMQDVATGALTAITDTPGYTETTIFSPDERLGLTMTSRFSTRSDPAILGLVPRPYPASLNMGLSMFAYMYAVAGVREMREGEIGPALIDLGASAKGVGYLGKNLAAKDGWVFNSPLSWHPGSRKGMWMENLRGTDKKRMRMVYLPDYRPGSLVRAKATPDAGDYASSDMSLVEGLAGRARATSVKVYGRVSGHIDYVRTDVRVSKTYVNFSDDGASIYEGAETMLSNPRGRSTYEADFRVSGPTPGEMKLSITFGPITGKNPSSIIFDRDEQGRPLSHGHASYGSSRLDVSSLVP